MIKNIRFQIGWGSSIGIRASKFFGVRKTSAQIFSKIAQKVVLWLLPTNFLLQKSWLKAFFGVTSKKGSTYFFAIIGCHIFPDFLGMCLVTDLSD